MWNIHASRLFDCEVNISCGSKAKLQKVEETPGSFDRELWETISVLMGWYTMYVQCTVYGQSTISSLEICKSVPEITLQ